MFKLLTALLMITNIYAEYSIKNQSELSLTRVTGNSSKESYNAKTEFKMNEEKNTFSLGGHYAFGKANNEKSEKNWDFHTRYDRGLSESFISFLSAQVETDEFANIDQRKNIDLGVKYLFLKKEKMNAFSELGVRSILVEDSDMTLAARLYLEFNNKHSESLSYKLWVEVIPSFENFGDDILVNIEPSISYTLSSNFLVKTAYLLKYNKAAVSPLSDQDTKFTTSLIANF